MGELRRQPHRGRAWGPRAASEPEPLTTAQLRTRAIRTLARREFSRHELFRKLAAYAASSEQLNEVLDQLAREGLLSDRRFAESLARRRAQRFGAARVASELRLHDLDEDVAEPLVASLRVSEKARALEVWRKRFGIAPANHADRARQYRFLLQRGFGGEAVSAVLREVSRAASGAPAPGDASGSDPPGDAGTGEGA